ncbi:uncharacterized protein LAJ45_11323 [Morchella importuna]|uniref:uncharacterized protein n=1 Tax=Morchella importuna TaxID=1174673 RepID=UPI001E8D1C32|nr:uncharacterized protein LAJ45_11323 [Morchella importuna]KAH8144662.1 hypothetical protein LAJ45_11323 [Morchella importuna]
MPSPSPIASVPPELLLEVAEHLSARALSAMCRTCRYYNSICSPILTDYLFKNKERILLRAAVSNRPHIIFLCVKKGVTLGGCEVGELLGHVAKRGYAETMRLLLDAGANPNCMDSRYKTPLYHAVACNWLKVAVCLVGRGAEFDDFVCYALTERDIVMKSLFKKFYGYRY